MDDFTKQKIAEQKYKKIRDEKPELYNGDFSSDHYKEVKNASISQTIIEEKDVYSTKYKQDFDSASKDFWQRETQKGLVKYNGGSLTANFGKDRVTIEDFLGRFSTFIKESITNELVEKKISTDALSENFKAIDVALNLLSKTITQVDKDISIENLSAFMHGFINTYVSKTIHKKIERDKGNTII